MISNEFINKRRKELSMSIDDLVVRSGIPKSTLSKITAGINTNPTLATVEALCKALKCTLNDVAGHSVKNQPASNEMLIIKKYRMLDEYGKKAVDALLEIELRRCENENKPPVVVFRRLSTNKASAGSGYDLNNVDEWREIEVVDCPEARRADFAVRIDGASMEPTYYDGDILFIQIADEIPVGKIGLFIKAGKGYVKEYGEDRLISHNEEYDDIYPDDDDIECVGRVIGIAELP